MISTLLTLAAVVACTIAFPVVQNCTTPPDLFAYCNKSVNNTEPRESLAMLYKESNIIITLLEDRVCNKTVSVHGVLSVHTYKQYMTWFSCNLQVYICGIDCNVPKVSLTDDRDEQNDAVYSQLRTLHKQLLLLDDHCTTENSTEDNTTTKLCETFQTGVHHLIQQITDYVRNVC